MQNNRSTRIQHRRAMAELSRRARMHLVWLRRRGLLLSTPGPIAGLFQYRIVPEAHPAFAAMQPQFQPPAAPIVFVPVVHLFQAQTSNLAAALAAINTMAPTPEAPVHIPAQITQPPQSHVEVGAEPTPHQIGAACCAKASTWACMQVLLQDKNKYITNSLRDMVCCSFCGAVIFANQRHSLIDPLGPLSPYAFANAIMADRTEKEGKWVVCQACKKNPARCAPYLPMHPPEYLRRLLQCDPHETELLSFVNVHLDIVRRIQGFITDIQ